MDAIGPKPFGQVHAIIDDKRYIAVGADTLQRFGCASDNMLVNAFKTEVEGRDRAGIKGRSQPACKSFVNRRGGSQIKMARLTTRSRSELNGETFVGPICSVSAENGSASCREGE